MELDHYIYLTKQQLYQRLGSATGYRQRPFDFKVEVVIVMKLSTRGG